MGTEGPPRETHLRAGGHLVPKLPGAWAGAAGAPRASSHDPSSTPDPPRGPVDWIRIGAWAGAVTFSAGAWVAVSLLARALAG